MASAIVKTGDSPGSFYVLDRLLWVAKSSSTYGGFLKLRVPFLGVPIIRTIVFWGLYWGSII